MSQTQKVLELNNRKITLIGTAHVSAESISEVENVISDVKPDCVAIELDEKRYESITNPDKYRELDIIKVLKRKEGFLLLANIVMASFQKRMGKNAGVKPGEEMVAAINKAKELNIPTALVDRPIQITFRRAWKKTSAYGKTQLLSALLASGFSKDEISSEEIENLKQASEMDSMMKELSELMPAVKQVLIDERDQYLASHIWKAEGNNIVAVLGAGHLPGVEAHLKKIAENQASTDTSEIASIPESSIFSKIMSTEAGGVDYNEEHALVYGNESIKDINCSAEVHIIDPVTETSTELDEDEMMLDKARVESIFVANSIINFVENEKTEIFDK